MDDMVSWSFSVCVLEKRPGGIGQNNIYCNACHKTLTESEPHVKGKDHYNNLVWYTLEQPSPSMRLLDALPAVVREAKLNDELELVDRTYFSYMCRVCAKKNPFNGIITLESHLNGSGHMKAKKSMRVSSPTSPGLQYPSSSHPSSPPTGYPQPSQPPFDPMRQIQQNPTPTQYTASPPSQYPPSHQHYISTGSSMPPLDGLQNTSGQKIRSDPTPTLSVSGAYIHPDILSALQNNDVKRSSNNSFNCQVCNKDFTGSTPLLEHLKSDRHKKKVELKTCDSFSQLSIVHDGRHIPQRDAAPIVPGHENPVNWTVVPARPPQQPDGSVYRNLSRPRGLVLIFNYCFPGDREHERHGAKQDSNNLRSLFSQMGYRVDLHENLDKEMTKKVLQETQNSSSLYHYDSFIVFILSHGKEDIHFFTNKCTDDQIMSLNDVRYCFTDVHCPALIDKPKIFFVNFCRGRLQESRIVFDSLAIQQVSPKDMITVYACINQFVAPRDEIHGTIFIQVLCEVLAQHAHNTELRDLRTRMYEKLMTREGATPEIQDFVFTKKFYFNPM